jgi:2-deoxy-D-gluconate 3-dehydrogenase
MKGILDQFSLEGKKALVTGCSRGIGKAMALGLAEAGADIIGVSSSLKKNGSPIEKEVLKVGRRFWPFQCDFSDRNDLYRFIHDLKQEHSDIHILVSNAGTFFRSPATDHPDAEWDRVMEVNLNAHFILAREIGKGMVERGQGKIIFSALLTLGSLNEFRVLLT